MFGFKTGGSELDEACRGKLTEIAGIIRSVQGCRVEVLGHADDGGSAQQDYLLSVARAKNVVNYLIPLHAASLSHTEQ